MVQDIYIGVDGGATKAKVRVEDADGTLLGQAEGGPANIARASADKVWESIYGVLKPILAQHQLSLTDQQIHCHIGLGLAGCELPDVCDAFLAVPHPFKTIHLTTDAHVACIGAHLGHDGAIIIVGTGVVGYQIQGVKEDKVGGWGFPHDDEGGGAWLGLEATRLTFQWLDKRLKKSALLENVFAYFGSDLNQFVTWANRANSSEFGRLAPLVIQASKQDDAVAIGLMQRAAAAVDLVADALVLAQSPQAVVLPCALFGGIAPFIKPWLAESVQQRLVQRQGDANLGALLLIKNKVKQARGIEPDQLVDVFKATKSC